MNATVFNLSSLTPMQLRHLFTPIGFKLLRYMTPFFLTVGIIGNPLAFLVWISRKVRRNNSSAIYLAMLAVNDFFCNLLVIIYYLTTSWGFQLIDYPGICQMYNVLYIYFQYNSLPLVFGFTVERWIAVCYPFKRERCCTECRALIACALIFSTVFLTALPQSVVWHNNPLCEFNLIYQQNFFFIYQTTLEFVMSALIPILTLLLNIRVIVEMYRISVHNSHCSISKPSIVDKNDRKGKFQRSTKTNHNISNTSSFKSTTTTLLLVSFFHILTTLPTGVAYILQMIFIEGDQNMSYEQIVNDSVWISHFRTITSKDIIDMLSLSHYCFNIAIYLGSSQQFRSHLMLFIRIYLTKQDNLSHSNNNSYYKLRQTQDNNRTDMSLRRPTSDMKTKNMEVS